MQMKRLYIAGAGGFGAEVEDWLKTRGVEIEDYLDDTNPECIPINSFAPEPGDEVIIAIGDPKGREDVAKRLIERGAVFHNLILAMYAPSAVLSVGLVACYYSVISSHAKVGEFCHINLHSTVGHHVTLGNYCTLSCHVDLTGHVTVGDRCYFGSGARVLPRVKIGNDCIIGAGAVVVADVPDGATVYAAPARTL